MRSFLFVFASIAVLQPTRVFGSDATQPFQANDAISLFQAFAKGSSEITVTGNIKLPDYSLVAFMSSLPSDAIFIPIMGGNVVITGYIASNPMAYPVLDFNW